MKSMDHKAWIWRKKSSEKTILSSDKGNISRKGNEQDMHMADKAQELDISMKNLSEKLFSALTERNTKDDLVMKHMKVAEEAIAGWEKAEAEAECFKQELDEALQQRVVAEGRIVQLDIALKECMQQLHLVREEQEQTIHDSITTMSKEFDKVRIDLEDQLTETSKRLAKSGADNSHLTKLLQTKEKLVENLKECKSQMEADFDALNARLDSAEKENASLKYEVCMLEKELQMRNEEREFNRQSIEASQKQHLESMKKIDKLETECQRLRLLVRKRLPGPAALARMRNEVEILGRGAADTNRKRVESTVTSALVKYTVLETLRDSPNKRINLLLERLSGVEEENKILKETLLKKNNELQSSRTMYAHAASKLSQVEAQLTESGKAQTGLELVRSAPLPSDVALGSTSENSVNDEISCAESWASALISELEHFRSEKQRGKSCKSSGASELSLMDDFVEMEKLAVVAMDSVGGSCISFDENNALVVLETNSKGGLVNATGKELVPVSVQSDSNDSKEEMQSKYILAQNYPSWIQNIWKAILQRSHVEQRSLDKIIEDVQVALIKMKHLVLTEASEARDNSNVSSAPDSSNISGYITWRSPQLSPVADLSNDTGEMRISSNLHKSISKLIELIESIKRSSTEYTVKVFQWNSSEFSDALQNIVHVCGGHLDGEVDLEAFAGELSSTFDWIINCCFSLRDTSNIEDTVKKCSDCDCTVSELEAGITTALPEAEKLCVSEQHKLTHELYLKEENRKLKNEIINLECRKKVLDRRLQSTSMKNDALLIQLHESEQSIASLQNELVKFKEAEGMIEDQIESHKITNDDLDTQLTVVRSELNEARKKFSSLEVELENKRSCCEELEARCLELQLQLESAANKEVSSYNVDLQRNHLRTDWEISAASEKLAECQETILNLGKQLKALASPKEATVLDKVITTSAHAKISRRLSLLDQMIAEDDNGTDEELKSPKTKEVICTGDPSKPDNASADLFCGQNVSSLNHNTSSTALTAWQPSPAMSSRRLNSSNETRLKVEPTLMSLAIVPKKQKGLNGLWRKLLLRKNRKSSKKVSLSIAA